jgi:hypothetical protein
LQSSRVQLVAVSCIVGAAPPVQAEVLAKQPLDEVVVVACRGRLKRSSGLVVSLWVVQVWLAWPLRGAVVAPARAGPKSKGILL